MPVSFAKQLERLLDPNLRGNARRLHQAEKHFSSTQIGAWLNGLDLPNDDQFSLLLSFIDSWRKKDALLEVYQDAIDEREASGRPWMIYQDVEIPANVKVDDVKSIIGTLIQLEDKLEIRSRKDRIRLYGPSTRIVERARRLLEGYFARTALKTSVPHPPAVIPAPSPTSAPTVAPASSVRLHPTIDGFDIEATPGLIKEADDPTQRAIFQQLSRRVKRLEPAMTRLTNSHPELVAEFEDYKAFLSDDIAETNVAALWLAGSGLAEFITALNPDRLAGTMTEAVEPAVLADLRSLIVSHKTFVEGTLVGQEMRERVARFNESGEPPETVNDRSRPILGALLSVSGLLTKPTTSLVSSLHRALGIVQDANLQLTVSSSEMARNAVLAVSTYIYKLKSQLDFATVFIGGNSPKLVNLSLVLFRDHASPIMALAINDPQMRIWLEEIFVSVMGDISEVGKSPQAPESPEPAKAQYAIIFISIQYNNDLSSQIKEIRAITGWSVKASEEFIGNAQRGQILKKGVTMIDADTLVARLKSVGIAASVVPVR